MATKANEENPEAVAVDVAVLDELRELTVHQGGGVTGFCAEAIAA